MPLESFVTAWNAYFVRAKAASASAKRKAAHLAMQSSTNLSRLVFLGVLALALLPSGPEEPQKTNLPLSAHVEVLRTKPVPAQEAVDANTTKPGELSKSAEPEKSTPPPEPLPPSKQSAPDWTSSEIATAQSQCSKLLDKVTLVATDLPPAREGVCGAPAPRLLRSLGKDKVEIDPPASLDCPMIAALNTWISDKLQPVAKKRLGSHVTRITTAGAYSCRNRYGRAKGPISEHALMNAIDVTGFVLANGKVIRVATSWSPPTHDLQGAVTTKPTAQGAGLKILVAANSDASPVELAKLSKAKPNPDHKHQSEKDNAAKEAQEKSAFLHEAHDGACKIFGTVLGPDANAAHHGHFHLDMKARKYHSICE
jgi:hypothetical protein